MNSNVVDLAVLPIELLEKIVSQLDNEEICLNIRHISKKFAQASYNVMRNEFLAVKPFIKQQIQKLRKEIEEVTVNIETFQEEMILVAKFTFLQVIYSEYRILCTLFFQTESVTNSPIIFKAVKNLDEFYNLLNNSSKGIWDWRTNVSVVIDKLRSLNSDLFDDFFLKDWDIKKNPFGPLFIKLLECSICSKYQISVCHETTPIYSDSKCRISGQYEIPDLSSTLSHFPGGTKNPQTNTRLLAAYVCDSIRWGNLFHTLRLRWICMDRALALARRQVPEWPLLDPDDPYLHEDERTLSETETELRNSIKKTCRILEKTTEDTTKIPLWLGIRCNLKLWCPITKAPNEMFKPGKHREFTQLPEGATSLRPYLFKLEFRLHVKAVSIKSHGIVETAIWLEETLDGITYTQSKQLIA